MAGSLLLLHWTLHMDMPSKVMMTPFRIASTTSRITSRRRQRSQLTKVMPSNGSHSASSMPLLYSFCAHGCINHSVSYLPGFFSGMSFKKLVHEWKTEIDSETTFKEGLDSVR